jgi:hypothetical protein
LTFYDIAAAQESELNLGPGQIEPIDGPETAFRILEHHPGIDAADFNGEGVEVCVSVCIQGSHHSVFLPKLPT